MTNPVTAPARGARISATIRPNAASRMSDLLRRYPAIADEERLQLIDFVKNGHPDDIVQATYAVGLEPRLIALRKDHPEHFPSSLRTWGPLALLVILPTIALIWMHLR